MIVLLYQILLNRATTVKPYFEKGMYMITDKQETKKKETIIYKPTSVEEEALGMALSLAVEALDAVVTRPYNALTAS